MPSILLSLTKRMIVMIVRLLLRHT